MSIDKTLKRSGRLSRSRNVLKREERILQMQKEEKWLPGRSPLSLPKTRVLKVAAGKKKKKAKEEEAGATPGAAPAAPAAAAPAAGKPAAGKPAAGGKPSGKK